jgi:hypothetical protein
MLSIYRALLLTSKLQNQGSYSSTHPVIRHIRTNAMNDEKIGFVYDKVNISITVYQVRMAHVKRLK